MPNYRTDYFDIWIKNHEKFIKKSWKKHKKVEKCILHFGINSARQEKHLFENVVIRIKYSWSFIFHAQAKEKDEQTKKYENKYRLNLKLTILFKIHKKM